jgi:hypothetical protein
MPLGRSFRKDPLTLDIAQQTGTEQNRHGKESPSSKEIQIEESAL